MKKSAAVFAVATLLIADGALAEKLKNMSAPASPSWFMLDSEHVSIELRGKKQTPFVTFLSAGIYRAEAEDSEGIYYVGPLDCIQLISRGDAKEYLESTPRFRPPKNTTQGEWWIIGGVWLPKPGIDAAPRLFYDIETKPKSFEECKKTWGCSWILGMLAQKLLRGTLTFQDYSREEDFVASLVVRQGEHRY